MVRSTTTPTPQLDGSQPSTPSLDTRDAGRIRRRVARFKQAGLLDGGTARVFQAIGLDDLKQAYRLVHDVFLQQSYIKPQPGGLRLRKFEAQPETATFVAKVGDRVVAVMSVVPDSPDMGLPSDKVFDKELNELRRQGRRIGEITNLAVAEEYRNTSVFFELSRCCNAHGQNIGLDDYFISISPGHGMFFEAVLAFEAWGERRTYDETTGDVVEGKRLNLRTFADRLSAIDSALGQEEAFLYDWFFTKNPHFGYTKLAARVAALRFLDPNLLRELFVRETDMLSRCSQSVLEAIQQRWGIGRFHQVANPAWNVPETAVA